MKTYSFEKLIVWNQSRALVKEIYSLTKLFPKEELFGLTSQIRRAAISVSSNLAEGSARISRKEKARFSEVAFGSLMEVLNQLILAQDLGYISESDILKRRPLIEEIANKINKLRKSQLNS